MRTRRTLHELAAEIKRQAAGKRDFLADTGELTLLTVGDTSELHLAGSGEFPLRRLAHDQIADHLGIPRAYYSRLRQAHPALLDLNVNRLFRDLPQRRMVRALDGQVRAFLSNRYRRLDNDELAEAILPVLGEISDVEFPSTEITDTRSHVQPAAGALVLAGRCAARWMDPGRAPRPHRRSAQLGARQSNASPPRHDHRASLRSATKRGRQRTGTADPVDRVPARLAAGRRLGGDH